MTRSELYRHIAFVLRCSGAAAFTYVLAGKVGLPHPVWATITSVVVAQEKLHDTNRITFWRLAGTMTGVVMAVIVGGALIALGAPVPLQLAGAAGSCAILARIHADLKVSIWTSLIVLLTRVPPDSVLQTGLWRGGEVLLGGLVGISCHFLAEQAIAWLGAREHPAPSAAQSHD